MKRAFALLGLAGVLLGGVARSGAAEAAPAPGPIMALPAGTTVQIIYTDVLGDKKSIRHDLSFSNGQTLHVTLRDKREKAIQGKPAPDPWQLIIQGKEWTDQTQMASRSADEKRLVEMLKKRLLAITDEQEKKNTVGLIDVLSDRSQSFPGANSGKWALHFQLHVPPSPPQTK